MSDYLKVAESIRQNFDNIEMHAEISFDNWMIHRHLIGNQGLAQLHNDHEYSDMGYLADNIDEIKSKNNPIWNLANPHNNDTESEATSYTSEYCNNVIHISSQLKYIDTLWQCSDKSSVLYPLRETLRNWITTSSQIQRAAFNEKRHPSNQDVLNMERIFRDIPPTTHAFVVYRIFTTDPGEDWVPEDSFRWNENHRFMSTSLSKTMTSGYAGNFIEPITEESHHIKIVIPPGNKIIPVLHYLKWSRDPTLIPHQKTSSEFEIILPRYQRLYNLPDYVRTCPNGKECKFKNRCRHPHFIRRYRIADSDNSDDSDDSDDPYASKRISGTLASVIERARIEGIDKFIGAQVSNYRRINIGNISDSPPSAQLSKDDDKFDLIATDDPITTKLEIVPFEHRVVKPRIIPLHNQIDERNWYSIIPEYNYNEDITPPDVSDLHVLLPSRCSDQFQLLALQNGWYLIYKWNRQEDTYRVSLYHPRFLKYNHKAFDGSHHYPIGGGNNASTHKEKENPHKLINEIGLDEKIPLYDKLHIIYKMKQQLKKEGKKIVATL